ncbi:MAG: hypothetical protein H5T50_10495 [Nitrososphaeria archaeon]|nr:hypothetical protein [Nitrososphaeria archaeon]
MIMNGANAYLIKGDPSAEFRLVDDREIDFDLGKVTVKLYINIKDSSYDTSIYKIRDGHIKLD